MCMFNLNCSICHLQWCGLLEIEQETIDSVLDAKAMGVNEHATKSVEKGKR